MARRSRMLGLALAAAATTAALGACGSSEPGSGAEGGVIDPEPAVAVLRAYLDEDRCDLISDRMAAQIAADPEVGRSRCTNEGLIPVDALVQPGEYEIRDAEIIDDEGLMRVVLDDGGEREYTLIKGGEEGFLVDDVRGRFEAEVGEPLRLQARETPSSPPTDARIVVRSIERLKMDELGVDEYVTSMDHYYRVRVSIRSRLDEPQLLGSAAFLLTTKEGYPIGEPVTPLSDLGPRLYSELPPGGRNAGVLFFAVPKEVKAGGVTATIGAGATRGHTVWKLASGGSI